MTARSIQVDLYTASYRVVGRIGVTGTGVLGLLSDTTSSFMGMSSVSTAPLQIANTLAEHASLIRVVKQHIMVVCLGRREDVGVVTLGRSRLTRAYKYPVRITTPVYELEGNLEWPGRFDFTAIMAEGTCDFIPLYEATLKAVHLSTELVQCPAMLFNRSYVDTLVLLSDNV